MKKSFQCILSLLLAVSFLLTASVPAFAAAEEVYLSELRLVYADSYQQAKEILNGTEFKDYKILNENLNEDTGEIGVWLAYKETTDIEDAITDLAVIQAGGGYREGNYQEMIKKSYDQYVEMGEIYLQAIEYFVQGYNAGHFLSESAYRQLNFYNVVSEGIPQKEIPSFEGEHLGDIFLAGISETELATMFLEGNFYALQNVRSLIAMGVSYNADGMTYLDKVEQAVKTNAGIDPSLDRDYDELAALIAPSVGVIQQMLEELSAYESELVYTDEAFTDDELKYAEHKAVAEMLRDVEYLGGKTLYQFCLDYQKNESDYSDLYPLVTALNEGQEAMTKVAHYYDVVRYSMPSFPEDLILSELDKMEEIYGENPFNIYSGVDRTIYDGTFALTNEAYRADVYGEGDLLDALFGGDRWKSTVGNIVAGTASIGVFVWAIVERGREVAAPEAVEAARNATASLKKAFDSVSSQNIVPGQALTGVNKVTISIKVGRSFVEVPTFGDAVNALWSKHNFFASNYTVFEKYQMLIAKMSKLPREDQQVMKLLSLRIKKVPGNEFTSYNAYQATMDAATPSHLASNLLFVVGGALLLYSAVNTAMTVFNYYHPEYEDIPIALVDLIETVDGDRYIKYDAVFEAEAKPKGGYAAGDLNAFAGQRWNALYYTKSYEAGKPLLADEFTVSNSNNKPKDGYAPVHRFGEVVCYDLNKYNFNDDNSVYLSVKQSKNQKSAVADVPQVVGSIFADGFWMLFSGVGFLAGVGCTFCVQSLWTKRRTKKGENV